MIDTPLGPMLAASRGTALCGLWFECQRYFPQDFEEWTEKPDLPVFVSARRWLAAYFAGKAPPDPPPLAPEGTAYRKAVWRELLNIPRGATASYGSIAEKIGGAARSVGQAVGHNPVSVIIPCHRVTGADGSLTGYAGGLERKKALLEIEQKIK